MSGLFGHVPESGVTDLTSATLPAVAAMAIVPVASGDGSGAPLLPAEACWTR